MSICYQLTPVGSDTPEGLNTVDAKMCKHFGVEVDSHLWYKNWHNSVGLCLAFGDSFDTIRKNRPEMAAVCDFLELRYTVNSWRD